MKVRAASSFPIIIFVLITLLILPMVHSSEVEFQIKVESRYYQPYEEVPLNVTFTSYEREPKNVTLVVEVGGRKFKYDFYEVRPNKEIKKTIVLPQQTPGRHVVKGRIYYSDNLGNTITESAADDIEVLFPKEIKSYPKRVVVASFEPPQTIYGGKSYIVKSRIDNAGDLEAKILVELGSYDEFQSREIVLKPGESETIDLNMTFYSTGLSFLESRIFYIEGEHKYLVNYFAKESVVTDEKIADITFDHLEPYLESNMEINQNDEVKLRVHLLNRGKFPAFGVIGYLTGNVKGLTLTRSRVDYGTISPKLVTGGASSDEYFEIATKNVDVQETALNLTITYRDNENRTRSYVIPINIFAGDDKCFTNYDCKAGFYCGEGVCQELVCQCGEKTDHRCINPTDSKCPEGQRCNYLGVCEAVPCACGEIVGNKCVLQDDKKCSDNQRCSPEGQCVDISCPGGEIKDHKCDKKCRSDAECGPEAICNEYNRCEPGCRTDANCPSNKKCGVNKVCEEIPCSCGEVVNKQCVKYACCSDSDCGVSETCDLEIRKCVSRTGCLEVIKNGEPKDKLDILFVGDGYDDYKELKEEVIKLVDMNGDSGYNGLMSVEPFKSNKNKINVWMIKAPDYKHNTQKEFVEDINRFKSICPQQNRAIVISKNDVYRSFASITPFVGGDAYCSINDPEEESSTKGRLILHEFGHSFSGLSDEYVEKDKRDSPDGPNCAPDLATAKKLWGELEGKDGVGYYTGVKGLAGTEYLESPVYTYNGGCSYTKDNIRPTKMSIMLDQRKLESDYGPVNERWLKEKLSVFK